MRYLLIVAGLFVGGFGLFLVMGDRTEMQNQGMLFGIFGGTALAVGLATCDVVAAIRETRPNDDEDAE